jgi:hypothetical protein
VLDLWTDLLGWLDLQIEHERSEPDNVTVFEDGTLVASYAQEALLRFRDGAGR